MPTVKAIPPRISAHLGRSAMAAVSKRALRGGAGDEYAQQDAEVELDEQEYGVRESDRTGGDEADGELGGRCAEEVTGNEVEQRREH
ncbi:hypothetical protein ACF09J_32145 [Streptomyces sp. NPDC014889]|uniref:hypothetical protein n=1 Tax=Streptomyces sp. NPDC014889 TaxID=3364928 RepID=UPI0036F74B77